MLQKVQFKPKTSSAFNVRVLQKEASKPLIFPKPGACMKVRAPALPERCGFSRQNVGHRTALILGWGRCVSMTCPINVPNGFFKCSL